MSRSLSILCLSLGVSACTTVEDIDEDVGALESYEVELSPVAMHPELDKEGRELPGTLVFDTSEGRVDITHLLPDKPREFATREELHHWVIENLNAQVVEREDGGWGTSLDYAAATTFRFDREREEYVPVDDPVEAILGGAGGYILIAGERHCVSRTAACAAEIGLEPPSRERIIVAGVVTGTAGRFGILGKAWHSAPKAFVPFYTTAGSLTSQWNATSGVRLVVAPCSNGFPWCVFQIGTNNLVTSFFARRGGGFIPGRFGVASGTNTFTVLRARGDWDVWPFTGTDNVCATHIGISGPDVVVLQSGHAYGLPINDCP